MTKLVKFVLFLAGLFSPPSEAIEFAVKYEGAPEYLVELKSISHRESRHQPVGVHEIDAWASEEAWRKGHQRNWLHAWCPFHLDKNLGWASRGNFGLFSAYHLRYLDFPCLPPKVLDFPFVAAIVSIRKMRYICERYDACTKSERRWVWSGLSVFYRNKNENTF